MNKNKDIVEQIIDKYRLVVIAVVVLIISLVTFLITLKRFSDGDTDSGIFMFIASTLFLWLSIRVFKKHLKNNN